MARRSHVAVVVTALVLSLAVPAAAAPVCWHPPVRGTVIDGFRLPPCRWCPGNRGLEYRTRPGSPVRSVAAGVVAFSGVVAGTRYVVIRLPDGRRVTYGRLATSRLDGGDRVVRGSIVGTAGARFYFGVRVGDRYVDPALLLGRAVGRPRLVPVDGTPPRPSTGTIRCV